MLTSTPAPAAVTGAPECRVAARTGDLVGAWGALLAATGAADPVLGPRGHGLRPTTAAGDAAAGADVATAGGDVAAGADVAAAGGDVVAAGTGWRPLRAAGADNRPTGWVPALTWLRLGLSEWLLARAVEFLNGRMSGGVPLIQQQLVRGSLAEVVIAQREVLGVLDAQPPGPMAVPLATHLHAELTSADRTALRLFGASGFLVDGPGQVAYLSELLADAYLDAEDGDA
jgi:hypothetical protein